MSTDRSAPEVRRAPEATRSTRGFRKALLSTVLVLAVVVAGLTAASVLRGPRVTGIEVSADGVVEREGQRIRVTVDQELDPASADRITLAAISAGAAIDPAIEATGVPVTGFAAAIEGTRITLTLEGTLRYATEYALVVPDARGSATGATADVEARFTTSDPPLHALERAVSIDPLEPGVDADPAPDRIVRRTVSGGDPQTVLSADRIEDYTVVGPVVIALTAVAPGAGTNGVVDVPTNEITTVSLTDGFRGEIPLPSPGTVAELRGSVGTRLVGYTFTNVPGTGAVDYSDAFFFYDLNDQAGNPVGVAGLDGQPLRVRDWTFVPGTTSIVVQTPDESVLLIDLLAPEAITPLGQHVELRGFIPGTTRLVVADPDGGSTIDVTTGATTPLVLAEAGVGEGANPGPVVLVADDRYVQVFSDYPDGRLEARYLLVEVGPEASAVLYAPPNDASRIRSACLSPNGQFVAVETVSPEGVTDGYTGLPGFTQTTTVLVDVQTGDAARSFAGVSRDWCA